MMECGCTVEYDDSPKEALTDPFIHYCPLHKAAGALLEAAQEVLKDKEGNLALGVLWDLQSAVAKATGAATGAG